MEKLNKSFKEIGMIDFKNAVTAHWNHQLSSEVFYRIILQLINSLEKDKCDVSAGKNVTNKVTEDLKQYVKNILYACYDNYNVDQGAFDKWVEEHVDLIDQYFKEHEFMRETL